MRLALIGVASSALLASSSAIAAPGDAASAARAWLALIDHGQYGASWAAAGSLFKSHISRGRWSRMVAGVRSPLGPVVARTFAGDERSTSLPGAPDGTYDRVHFSTVFTRKASAQETLVMARQGEGWRVDGYFIR